MGFLKSLFRTSLWELFWALFKRVFGDPFVWISSLVVTALATSLLALLESSPLTITFLTFLVIFVVSLLFFDWLVLHSRNDKRPADSKRAANEPLTIPRKPAELIILSAKLMKDASLPQFYMCFTIQNIGGENTSGKIQCSLTVSGRTVGTENPKIDEGDFPPHYATRDWMIFSSDVSFYESIGRQEPLSFKFRVDYPVDKLTKSVCYSGSWDYRLNNPLLNIDGRCPEKLEIECAEH